VDIPPLFWEVTDKWVSNILRNADAVCLVVDLTDDPVGQAGILLEELQEKKIWPVPRGEDRRGVPPGYVGRRLFIAGNKIDVAGAGEGLQRLAHAYQDDYAVAGVSAREAIGLEGFVGEAFRILDKVRVYTKAPSKKPDKDHPFVVPKGTTVIEMAEEIHKEFVCRFRAARIYCADKYDGQRVGKDFVLRDGDVIEFLV
jgi:hypothetical protein